MATKENIQALLSARVINMRCADAVQRLISGESVSAIIASSKPPAPSGGYVSRPAPSGEPSKTLTFFGNLSYSVDDSKLNGLLSGYKLAAPAKVAMRADGRSLGFALVNFESAAEQERAIASLNNISFEGRPLNVAPSMRGNRSSSSSSFSSFSSPSSRPVLSRIPSVTRAQGQSSSSNSAAAGSAPRQQRPPRQPASEEASKTTLFVANLPYIVDDAGLLQIFEGFQVKEAHIPRRRNGVSTGYGFVTLTSEAEAQRAIREVDKSIVEKREISVRASFNRPAPAVIPK
jgi:RNA recognition motif-containing protein